MNNTEIKKFAQDYLVEEFDGSGNIFNEIEKAVIHGITIALSAEGKESTDLREKLDYWEKANDRLQAENESLNNRILNDVAYLTNVNAKLIDIKSEVIGLLSKQYDDEETGMEFKRRFKYLTL